jgi:hypothetical protein
MKLRKSKHRRWCSVKILESYVVLLEPVPRTSDLVESKIPGYSYPHKLFEGEIGKLDDGFRFISEAFKP